MAYDNTPIRNGQSTQTRPYVGWTKCPRCGQDALLSGYLHNYGTCSNCGIWNSVNEFNDDRGKSVGCYDNRNQNSALEPTEISRGAEKSAD